MKCRLPEMPKRSSAGSRSASMMASVEVGRSWRSAVDSMYVRKLRERLGGARTSRETTTWCPSLGKDKKERRSGRRGRKVTKEEKNCGSSCGRSTSSCRARNK